MSFNIALGGDGGEAAISFKIKLTLEFYGVMRLLPRDMLVYPVS